MSSMFVYLKGARIFFAAMVNVLEKCRFLPNDSTRMFLNFTLNFLYESWLEMFVLWFVFAPR